MKKLTFNNVEIEQQKKPVLIVDPQNFLGSILLENLKNDFFTVFVSPNKKIFPQIPDLAYEHIYIFSNGEKNLEEIFPQFIEQAEKTKGNIYFMVKREEVDYFADLAKVYKRLFLIAVGDVFTKNVQPDLTSAINKYLLSAMNFNQIMVNNHGLNKTYPVFIEDVISSILKISFTKDKNSQIFFIFPKHALTEISLAHIFQKINPLIKVDFSNEESQKNSEEIFTEGEYVLAERYNLQKRIKEVLDNLLPKKNLYSEIVKTEDPYLKKEKNKLLKQKREPLKLFRLLVFILIIFTILPALVTFLSFFLGVFNLQVAKVNLEKGDFSSSINNALLARSSFDLSKKAEKVLKSGLQIFGKSDLLEPVEKNLSNAKDITDFTYSISNSALSFSKTDFLQATTFLKDSMLIFQKLKTTNKCYSSVIPSTELESRLNRHSEQDFESIWTWIPYPNFAKLRWTRQVRDDIDDVICKTSPGINKTVQLLSGSFNLLPYIFGFDKEKTYLILFQNNAELRPTGGFIGSYGILKLKEGRVIDFLINDVYDADGQLKGHIEPPFAIRRYMGIVHWYLRDSNFSLDYGKAASSSAFFLKQELKQEVDGVFAVDVSFVKQLLKVTGPIYIPEYKETIDFDNFYMLTQTHAEKDFFPGSRQKKSFLSAAFRAIKNYFAGTKNISYAKLAESFGEQILEKHLLLSFTDKKTQMIFDLEKTSSTLKEDRVGGENIINDFLGINEANLGVNKANYFIYRDLKTNIKISNEKELLGETTLKYFNDSVEGRWPGGIYKNYLRIILPYDFELLSILIDGVEQKMQKAVTEPSIYEAKNFIPPNGLEVDKKEEGDKISYGFLVNVPTKTQKTITFIYKLSKKIKADLNFLYNFRLFKQPGIDYYPFTFNVFVPEGFVAVEKSKELSLDDDILKFKGKISKDTDFSISFSRK